MIEVELLGIAGNQIAEYDRYPFPRFHWYNNDFIGISVSANQIANTKPPNLFKNISPKKSPRRYVYHSGRRRTNGGRLKRDENRNEKNKSRSSKRDENCSNQLRGSWRNNNHNDGSLLSQHRNCKSKYLNDYVFYSRKKFDNNQPLLVQTRTKGTSGRQKVPSEICNMIYFILTMLAREQVNEIISYIMTGSFMQFLLQK